MFASLIPFNFISIISTIVSCIIVNEIYFSV